MTIKTKSTLERIVRVIIAVALVLSVCGVPASTPVAQAKTGVAQPVSEPKPEATLTPESTSAESAMTEPVRLPVYTPPVTSTTQLIDRTGGRLLSADQRVQLEIPEDLFKDSTRISIMPQAVEDAKAPSGLAFQFDLQAQDEASKTAITLLERPITLTVDLNGLIDRTKLQPFGHLAVFYKTDNPEAPWSELADAREVEPGIVQVPLAHFSIYAAGVSSNAPSGWRLKYNPPVVSTFSGAATLNYPIEVPPGRHGLQPSIVLGYNSHSADGVVSVDSEDIDGVPFAWAMDMASISRDGTELDFCGDCINDPTFLLLYPRFSLAINGANYDLIPATSGAYSGRYYAKDAPQLYVERHNKYSDPGTYGSIPNVSKEYWIVKTGDGTLYRFGYNLDAEQTQSMGPAHYLHCEENSYCGEVGGGATNPPGQGTAAVRWRVDLVTDTVGSQMTFTYHTNVTEKTFAGSGMLSAEHTRPNEIKYNYTNSVAASRIQFYNSQKTPDQQYTVNWFDRIYVYHAGETNKIREYQLGWDGELKRLLSIVQVNGAGTQALPATTFTYADLRKDWWNINYTPYLTRIDNSYGGATEFSYLDDGRYHYCGVPNCAPKTVLFGYSYRVIESRTYNGLTSEPAKVQYEYGTACYDQNGGGVPAYCRGQDPKEYGPLVGHQAVTQTVLAYGGTVLSRQSFTYNVDDNNSPLRGRELRHQTFDGNGAPLTAAEQVHATQANGTTTFTYLREQYETTYMGTLGLSQRTDYRYDSYGNQVAQYDFGSVNSITDDRSVHRGVFPNLTAWLVNQVAWENVYEGISENVGGAALKTQTLNYYDGAGNYQQPPTKGALTRVDRGGAGGPWVSTSTTYDAWGNPTIVTDPRGFTTTTVYDGSYHLYPVQVTNAKGHTTQISYDYALGLPMNTTDPNGTVITYRYDTFGRLIKVLRPGDSDSSPTTQYDYRMPYPWLTVPNGSFANTAGWTEWDSSNVQTYQVDTTQFTEGSSSLQIVATGTADHWVGRSDITGWQAGRTYWLSANVKSTSGAQFCLSVAAKAGHEASVGCVSANSGWQTVQGTLTLPADATQFLILLRTPQGGTVYVDEVRIGSFLEIGTYTKDSATGTLWSREVYDGLGRTIQTQSEKDNNQAIVVDMAYDARNQVQQQTMPAAVASGSTGLNYLIPDWTRPRTTTMYDGLGRVVRVTNADNTAQSTGFRGREVTTADANEHYQLSELDARGQLVRVDELLGNIAGQATATASSQYNADYAPAKAVDSNPWSDWATAGQTSNAWIKLTWGTPQTVRAVVLRDRSNLTDKIVSGRLQFSDGSWTPVQYLPNEGGPIAITFSARTITWVQFTIDTGAGANVGLAEFAVIPERNTIQYSYNTLGSLTGLTDALGNTTVMTYNTLNQKTGMIDPDMGAWSYQYDLAGNLITQTDAKGQVLGFNYDPLNRLLDKRQGGVNGTVLASYGYDAYDGVTQFGRGQRTSMADQSGSTTWLYDPLGRVTQESRTIAGAGIYNTFYTYDVMDRIKTITYPTGEVVNQTYNAASQLTSVYGASTYMTGLQYNANGSLALQQLGNGVSTYFGYFGLTGNPWDVRPGMGLTSYGRLWRSRTEKNGLPLADLRYSYDNVGNVSYIFDAPRAINGTLNYTLTDRFDTKNTAWWAYTTQTVPFNDNGNNVVKSTGDGVSWNAQFTRTQTSLVTGGGAELRFKVDNSTAKFILALENNDGSCRRFAVYGHDGKLNVQYNDGTSCTAWREPTTLLPALQANVWYTLTFVVDDVRGNTLEVRPANDPAKRYTYNIGSASGKQWRFHAWTWTNAAQGSLYLDDYREFNSGAVVTPDERMQFAYDALDRLLSANKTTTEGYTQSFGYNPIGNIISTTLLGTYTYNPSGLNSVRPHAATAAGSNSYQYDANGNMTLRRETGVDYYQLWTVDNRLEEVGRCISTECVASGGSSPDNNPLARYVYDGDGQRVMKINPNGSKTVYVNGFVEIDFLGGLAAPSNLSAVAVSASQINLAWTDNSANENGFKLERSNNGGSTWQEIATLNANVTTYSDTGLACNTTYIYRLRSYTAQETSGYSNIANATTWACPVPPAAPSNLSAVAVSASQINLAWTDNSANEDGFKIERSPDGVSWAEIAAVGANVTSYQSTGLACSTAYTFRVRAYNGVGNSGYSNTATAATSVCPPVPAAPSNLSATGGNLVWTDNSNNENGFVIERGVGLRVVWGEIAFVGANVTNYRDYPCGITPYRVEPGPDALQDAQDAKAPNVMAPPGSTTFYYRVYAYNAAGDSGYSNTAAYTTICSPIDVSPEMRPDDAAPTTIKSDATTSPGAAVKETAPIKTALSTAALADASKADAPAVVTAVPAGQVWKSYYFAGSQRVAMRETTSSSDTIYYFVADHLGSTSVTLDQAGNKIGEMKYYPYGETRPGYPSGSVPTDRRFTGQRQESGLGSLYDYGARFYSPVLGRFISADTMMQDWRNPQAFNRYAYVLNNPLKYTDPSGHYSCYVGASGPMVSQSAECIKWVETALTTLGTVGQLGKDLVDFLRAHDGISIIFSAAESYFSAPGSMIQISLGLLSKDLSTKEGLGYVSAFGHEIDHHRNGDGASIRGEMKAYEVERQLRSGLGADSHDKADRLNVLNPYNRADLVAARTILGDRYDEFPLTPLGEEALYGAMIIGNGVRGVFEEAGGALVNIGRIGAYGLDRFVHSLSVNLNDMMHLRRN